MSGWLCLRLVGKRKIVGSISQMKRRRVKRETRRHDFTILSIQNTKRALSKLKLRSLISFGLPKSV